MLNKGVYTDKELNSLIGLELKSQMVSHDDVLRTNKLEKVMKMTISLNELDNFDNLENGRPSNALFTCYVTSPEYSMQFEPSTPQYKKLKDRTITSLTLKITDQAGNIITDWARNDCSLKIHQDKTKCQTPENNLVVPPQKCFVSLQNVILSSCLTFDDSIYYRTSDNTFIPISNSENPVAGNKCYVQTKDIIIHPLTEYLSNDINQCGATSCHTCNIFVNNQSFESNLTGKEYKTISYDRLSCGSTNVIYRIHCIHCGLVYVGETGRSLRSRMNGHRSAIKKGGQSLLHRHFHQPDHSVDDMRVQILEKVYHSSENPTLLTSLRRTRELFWIKELGTAKPYGFNDQIKGVGTLSSTKTFYENQIFE